MPTPTDAAPRFQKYLFKGRATALKGSIRKPYYQELGNHLDIATYAGSGGRILSANRGFALVTNDITYESATTEIVAGEISPGVFECTVTSQVMNLKVGKRLTVGEVTCRLQSVYDSRDYPKRMMARISPAGSVIKDLQIDGKTQELKLPDAFFHDQQTAAEYLQGRRDQDTIYEPGFIPEPMYVTNFGTIYYAEWTWVHPDERHRQQITMLRLALGSDLGGDVDVSLGGNDGSGWPPLAN